MRFILDNYAVLTYLQGEAGTERIKEILVTSETGEMQTFLPLINLGEILYIVERRRGLEEAQRVLGVLKQLPITIVPAAEENVLAAAHIKANYPISYADAFIIAAAQELNATILTGDPEFDSVKEIVRVENF